MKIMAVNYNQNLQKRNNINFGSGYVTKTNMPSLLKIIPEVHLKRYCVNDWIRNNADFISTEKALLLLEKIEDDGSFFLFLTPRERDLLLEKVSSVKNNRANRAILNFRKNKPFYEQPINELYLRHGEDGEIYEMINSFDSQTASVPRAKIEEIGQKLDEETKNAIKEPKLSQLAQEALTEILYKLFT